MNYKTLKASGLAVIVSAAYIGNAYSMEIANDAMAITFDNNSGVVSLINNNTDEQITPTELFFITLPNETTLHTKDFKLEKYKKDGDSINLTFVRNDFEVDVTLNVIKQRYVSVDYKIKAVGNDRKIKKITFLPTKKQTQAPYVDGSINSSPIIADTFFMLPRKPIVNTYAYETKTNLNIDIVTPISTNAPLKYTTYIGTFSEVSQLRRDFNKFIEAMRPRPYKTYLHYNSWMDIGFFTPYTESDIKGRMKEIYHELVEKRGVVLDGFLLDDGWDDLTGNWDFGSAFADGFGSVKELADSMNTSVGLWLSPWGGYNKPRDIRVSHAKENGFETVDGKFALSGPVYFKNFNDKITNLIKNEHISSFKLDGMGNATSHLKGSQFASDFDASVQLIENMHKANDKVFINLTTGTNASPSWLFFADSIWRQGDDINLYGDGSPTQQWVTYRDAETYRSIVRKGPLFPMSSIMLHGIVSAKNAYYGLEKVQSDQDFADQVWSYFATGTQLQEMYITPDMLNSTKWDTLAKAAKWARENADVLVDSHWIGGNPTNLAVYGFASWNENKAVISLRNPSDKPQKYYLDLNHDFELPTGANGQFKLKMAYGENNTIPSHYTGPVVITLQPLQTLVINANK